MNDIHELTAGELLEAYRKKSLSPVDAMRAVTARVAAWEPHIKALYAYEPEHALREAEASHKRWMDGTPMGPLDGVPVTVKENVATKDVPVPLGTAATALKPAAQDAPPAARLREAGAIIFAK